MLGAIAHARLRLGDPAKARDSYREEIALRDQFSPAAGRSGRGPPRTRRASRQARRPERLPRRPESRPRVLISRRSSSAEEIAAQNPDETQAHRDVLLSLEKLGNHELIYSRDPKAAREYYQQALDGFLERLKAEPVVGAGQDGRRARALLCRHGRPSRGKPRRCRWPITASAATSAKSWPRTRRPSSARWT